MYSIGDKVAAAATPGTAGEIVNIDGVRPIVITVKYVIGDQEFEKIYLEEHLVPFDE